MNERFLLLASLLCAASCVTNVEVGTPCNLVRRSTQGGVPVAITEGELPLARADYLSFGSPGCSEVCVRGADFTRSGDNAAPASGHCSRPCAAEGGVSDCPSGFACRTMLLDPGTMEALCGASPSTCRPFAGNPWPLYCVRNP